jgi:hypothetical protein
MKKLFVFLLVLVLSVPAFAGGIVPYATGTLTSANDTTAVVVGPVANYNRAKFVFKLTQADTLRDDTVNVYIQTSKEKTTGYVNVFHLTRTVDSDTFTVVKEFRPDSMSLYNFTNFARFNIFFEDSSSSADTEVVRPGADETSSWKSTGGNDFGEIDETSLDTTDYIHADSDSSGVNSVTMGAHTATESTVDSVRINYSTRYVPVTTEVVVTSSDYIAGWSSTGANHYSVIDEALGSEDTADYIYILGADTLASVAIGNPASSGTATIDSAVLSVLHHSYVGVCTLEVGLCVSSATCDTCDCTTDTLAVTTDTARTAILFTTSPATASAWTAAELDSATLFVRSLGFEASAEGCISQVALTPYYTADASIKCAICVTDTSQCSWGDSTAVTTDTASHTFVLATNPSGDDWYISSMDSLVSTVKSQHVDNGSLRVFMEWMTIYYTSGTLVPAVTWEGYIILKE